MGKKPTYEELEQRVKELENETFDHNQAEEVLRESEKKYKHLCNELEAILDHLPALIFYKDKKGNFIRVNKYVADAHHMQKKELESKSTFDLYPEDQAQTYLEDDLKVIESSEPKLFIEEPWETEKGKRWVSTSKIPFIDEQGDILGIIGISIDTTERKQAEDALRERTKDLGERVKELNCLYGISNLVEKPDISLEEIFQGLVDLIPLSWQYPEITCSRMFLDDEEYKTENFKETNWKQSSEIFVTGKRMGVLEICSLEEKPEINEGPFLKEERNLIDAITERLGHIIERKQLEEALRESESLHRLHFENVSDVIYSVDPELKITNISPSVERVLGYKPEELIGRPFQELNLLAPEYLEQAASDTMHVLGGERITSAVYQFIARDGIKKWGEVSGAPVIRDGQIVALISVARDITERKQAEEALLQSEEKYRTVLESNPDPVVVYDMEGRVIFLNPAFTRVFGWSLEERLGKKIDNFVPEENWPETRMMINKVTTLGESFSGLETRRYTKEGNILDISISGSCYRDQEGNVAASVINLRDITDQKRLENQLQKAQAQVLESQKIEAIATLAGGVAHQFNNALSSITGHTGLLEMEYPEDEKITDYAKAMKQSAHRMAHLTSQLLAYARGGKYNTQTTSLSNFVEGALPIIRHILDPDTRVETNLPQDVMNVKMDRTQMQMVLSAILANSNEAIDPPGRIRISTRNMDLDQEFIKDHPELKPGPYVCLTIKDDGKGMDEDTRRKIFDPFFTTHFMGRGLGMASVYGIIKNHDGAITVESEPGKGTVVRIYLPAIETKEEVKKEAVLRPAVELAMGEGTILVIEDEEPLVKLFRQILEMLGYRVLEAKNGKEAVEIAKTFDGRIDLALLDIKLPDMSGNQVYPLIMEARPQLKVVVCSGYSIHGPAQEILDAGAEGFIQKPFLIAPFAEKLKEVLEGK